MKKMIKNYKQYITTKYKNDTNIIFYDYIQKFSATFPPE